MRVSKACIVTTWVSSVLNLGEQKKAVTHQLSRGPQDAHLALTPRVLCAPPPFPCCCTCEAVSIFESTQKSWRSLLDCYGLPFPSRHPADGARQNPGPSTAKGRNELHSLSFPSVTLWIHKGGLAPLKGRHAFLVRGDPGWRQNQERKHRGKGCLTDVSTKKGASPSGHFCPCERRGGG